MIVKRRVNRSYTIVVNDVFNDERLSLEAMGMLAWLRSKPHDWQLNVDHLRRRFEIGRDKTYKLIRELVEAGWIVAEESRANGVYQGVEYVVLDEPTDAPVNPLRKRSGPASSTLQHGLPFTENPEMASAEPVDAAKEPDPEPPVQPAPPFPEKPFPANPFPANQDAGLRKESSNTPPYSPPAEAGGSKAFFSEKVEGESLRSALETVAARAADVPIATAFRRVLEGLGFTVDSPGKIPDRGDGRAGMVDARATSRNVNDLGVALKVFEDADALDKHVRRIASFDGVRVGFVKRHWLTEVPPGLDVLIVRERIDPPAQAVPVAKKGEVAFEWIEPDTPEWEAWERHHGRPMVPIRSQHQGKPGRAVPSRWPPGREPTTVVPMRPDRREARA